VEKIGHALLAAGHQVRVLGWDRTSELPVQEFQAGLEVFRLPIRAAFGHGMGNLPQLIRWQWGLWYWLLRHRHEFDVIHACDFDTILPALWLKLFYGKRVVYDIFDFYADHLRATPAWIKNLIRKIDLWAIGKADALVLVDDSRREQITGSKPRTLAVVYNSPEDQREQFLQQNTSQSGSLRLAYIGLLQVERGLLHVLTVLKSHPNWHLDLAGFGGDEAMILAKAAGMPNVHWHGRVLYERALALSAAADTLFATYDPSIPNHRYSSPNKIFEAMMLGKPVIVAADTNMDRMIAQSDCGLIVPYGNVAALEAAFDSLDKDRQLTRQLGDNARRAYETLYSWDIMQQRLIQIYQSIV
jgi:glycosyltransferase involved in cell wall biosynthesis